MQDEVDEVLHEVDREAELLLGDNGAQRVDADPVISRLPARPGLPTPP